MQWIQLASPGWFLVNWFRPPRLCCRSWSSCKHQREVLESREESWYRYKDGVATRRASNRSFCRVLPQLSYAKDVFVILGAFPLSKATKHCLSTTVVQLRLCVLEYRRPSTTFSASNLIPGGGGVSASRCKSPASMRGLRLELSQCV